MPWGDYSYTDAGHLTVVRTHTDGPSESALTSSQEVQDWVGLGGIIGSEPSPPTVILPDMGFNCYPTVVSPTLLTLFPKNGSRIFIDGVNYRLPVQGVSIVNTGLVAANIYWLYIHVVGVTLTLELSSTSPDVHPTYGHLIKSGSNGKTLVAMIYAGAGAPGTFVDSNTQRFVASYYNRKFKTLQRIGLGADRTTASPTLTELSSADRVEFISFCDEDAFIFFNTSVSVNAQGNIVGGAVRLDAAGTTFAANSINAPQAGNAASLGGSEGNSMVAFAGSYTYLTLLGKVADGATATFYAAETNFGALLRQ